MTQTCDQRYRLIERLFPDGIPRLWCPPLTHYDAEGRIDHARMQAHLAVLAPHARGWLVPGSTGDGWEMEQHEVFELLNLVLDQARVHGVHVLIGVLRKDPVEARDEIRQLAAWLMNRQAGGTADPVTQLPATPVCGFTVCPPAGAHLTQDEVGQALESILTLGYPTALYQLPQVTGNEMSPALVAQLAARWPNFVLLKDSSGQDRLALSGADLGNVFLVRGAEGDYARWLKSTGGPYDGYLLSTANCFASHYDQLIRQLDAGEAQEAARQMARIERVVADVFASVASLQVGNPFTNANKAIDHFLAYGPRAASAPAPRLHAGPRLPQEILSATAASLASAQLLPTQGYWRA